MLKLLKEQAGRGKTFLYTGKSMNPTFKDSDILHILPYHDNPIRCGDVVVYSPSDSEKTIVHRVVSVDPQGIKTRGDNNPSVDESLITPERIFGRVASAQKGRRQLRVSSGLKGRLYVSILKPVRILDMGVSSLLHYPYHWLAQTGIFRRLLPAGLKIRVLSFNKPAGPEMQLLMGRWVVGQYHVESNLWQIRRPFRLFVDEEKLAEIWG